METTITLITFGLILLAVFLINRALLYYATKKNNVKLYNLSNYLETFVNFYTVIFVAIVFFSGAVALVGII